MELYKTYRPKLDWHGNAWKWYCPPCSRGGSWDSQVNAVASGHSHNRDKHGQLVTEWKLIGADDEENQPAVAQMDGSPSSKRDDAGSSPVSGTPLDLDQCSNYGSRPWSTSRRPALLARGAVSESSPQLVPTLLRHRVASVLEEASGRSEDVSENRDNHMGT